MIDKDTLEFSKIISGVFSNKEQALNNPKHFAHIQEADDNEGEDGSLVIHEKHHGDTENTTDQ